MNEEKGLQGPSRLSALRSWTPARIMLGRTGVSLPLAEQQRIRLAHARARDAIFAEWDEDGLVAELDPLLPVCRLRSRVRGRQQYLLQPGLGRQLDDASKKTLEAFEEPSDICIVIGDGLSPVAVRKYAYPFLSKLMPMLGPDFTYARLCVVQQARVAIADEIGHLLKAKCTLILIGERPGLSSPESMGLYLTYAPRPGLTDACRNCISNIREGGLDMDTAAAKANFLIREMFRMQISGTALKDHSNTTHVLMTGRNTNG
jgi:ethanolamine ammonia-lyase small subunit